MKKITVLLALGLSLSLLLSACNKDEESSSAISGSASTSGASSVSSSAPTDSTSAGSTAASGSSLPAASGSAVVAPASTASGAVANSAASGTTAPVAPAPVVNMGGIYNTSDTERYPDDRAPYLELSDKGGFVLHFNLGDGRLAVMTGTYESTGSGLQMDVMYCDSDDFLGQDLTSFSFSQEGSNGLAYGGAPLGMTRSGDVFSREGSTMGTGGGSGKNVYVLEPGRILEEDLPATASTASNAPQPTATANVASSSISASVPSTATSGT